MDKYIKQCMVNCWTSPPGTITMKDVHDFLEGYYYSEASRGTQKTAPLVERGLDIYRSYNLEDVCPENWTDQDSKTPPTDPNPSDVVDAASKLLRHELILKIMMQHVADADLVRKCIGGLDKLFLNKKASIGAKKEQVASYVAAVLARHAKDDDLQFHGCQFLCKLLGQEKLQNERVPERNKIASVFTVNLFIFLQRFRDRQ
jgi:hypothetical protein